MNSSGEILKTSLFSEPYYIIFYDLDHKALSTTHENWPRHLTIVPPFFLPEFASQETMLQQVESIARHGEQITLEYGERKNYGIREDIPVFEMEDPSGGLKKLHKKFMRYLGSFGMGCHFPDVKFALEGYKPHISRIAAISSLEEELVINSVTVGKRDPAMRGAEIMANKMIVANYVLSPHISNIALRS